ncbi:MAG: acyl transferase, partial [Daejeonella sp.]
MQNNIEDQIFNIQNHKQFEDLAMEIFRFQAKNCKVYADFIKNLGKSPENVQTINEIPFLPIEFFKHHTVYSSSKLPEITFSSSGTTGMITSKHDVAKLSIYEKSFKTGFKHFYGDIKNYTVLA